MWVIFSLLASLLEAFRFTVSKKLIREIDMLAVLWWMLFLASPLTLIFCYLTSYKLPLYNPHFLLIGIIANISSVGGEILMIKAIKNTDLSLSLPFYALTPVFIVLGELVFFHALPSKLALFGILLIVMGSYSLNFSSYAADMFKPFKLILKNAGSTMALFSAFLFAVTGLADKFLIQQANQYAYLLWVVLGNLFWLSLYLFFARNSHIFSPRIFKSGHNISLNAWYYFASVVFTILAYNLTLASNVTALKRTTVLWGIIFGYLFFQEKKFFERLLGSAVMVAGVVLVIVYTV